MRMVWGALFCCRYIVYSFLIYLLYLLVFFNDNDVIIKMNPVSEKFNVLSDTNKIIRYQTTTNTTQQGPYN